MNTTTNATATLTAHPTDPAFLILRTAPGDSARIGSLEPARYEPSIGAYILHVDHETALNAWAHHTGVRILDLRPPTPGKRTAAPECSQCGHPAKLTAQPCHCPACGRPWAPHYQADDPATPNLTTCPQCEHRQARAFTYCGQCGQPMPTTPRPTPQPLPPRPILPDPLALADTLDETLKTIT